MNLVAIPRRFCTRAGIRIEQRWLQRVEEICQRFSVLVESGYRTQAQNHEVGGAENSDHLRGDAADFAGTPHNRARLHNWADGRFPYVEPNVLAPDHVHISFRHLGHEANPPVGPRRMRPLAGMAFMRTLWASCHHYDVDPIAAAAVGNHEGSGGEIGDNGWSYGPWMLHHPGALPARWAALGPWSQQTNAWAWSRAGIGYAISKMAEAGAGGKRGTNATRWIVYHFEHPRRGLIRQEAAVSAITYREAVAWPAGAQRYFAMRYRGPLGGGQAGAPPHPPGTPREVDPGAAGPAWTGFIHTLARFLPAKRTELEAIRQHIRRGVH